MSSSTTLPDAQTPAPAARERFSFLSGLSGRPLFAVAYVLAFLIVGGAIWVVATAPSAPGVEADRALTSQAVLAALLLNLLIIGALAAVVGRQVLALVRDRSRAGSRLHLRFVTLFSLVAVAPAVVIALVFGVLVSRGVDQWFSKNVSDAVENGADIARAYLRDVGGTLESDLSTMANELTAPEAVAGFREDRIWFSALLAQTADIFGYPALYIIDGEGRVLARGELPGAPRYRSPPAADLELAAEGEEAPSGVTEAPDAVRALYPLNGYGDAYLYAVRPLQPGLISKMRTSEQSIVAYRQAAESRSRLQWAFALSYLETALLVLVGAVGLGMAAASAISAPIGRLISAADQVAAGDLSARVDEPSGVDDLAALSNAFNRMTGDLQAQQTALLAASEEAVGRTRFIETVLSGVSAGVIGLDRKGRISAVNESAVLLLGIAETDLIGMTLAEVSPELSDLLKRGEAHIEEDVDVTRGGETRRLRVRIEGGLGGEMVLTFDDITRLVTAQRNAAWRDVARRIAHEIKNPLTPIQLSAERLRRRYRSRVEDDVETFDRCTETIIRQVGDIGRMVDEFSSFARMPTPRFTAENPAELLREAVFAQRVAQPEVTVDMPKLPAKVVAHWDGRMVGQALTNILKNAGEAVLARRAMEGGAPLEAPAIRARLVVEDHQACFIVEDDGIGLPEKDRDRLTEPYVTTREKGTGLGLAIVRRICEDHGGELRLGDAETLRGARMTLVFPLKPGVTRAPIPANATAN
ncbi:MAG: PAS domain-containing sensor histidine kinase [Alphaproteobacteria bacterium]|nr:PAS domain-containing sensor histidine kinase [Alphaproteobacteria bacterium]MBU1525667.1 PAS domain-containing sensor histidine kinase [Alphaproteobacteria bacterium]MBU2118188.1 PAS domain-containing sensor histidine kinase [Alphaproteobacteria bacterium]MBU2351952.1 PAS domain-containing sensor histidine kinase [Alphaproteobacteria bacterium]MBU2383729.1 PAS domain-containing sensor histidine kinase [Alphaproteobacteria bacterium]